MAKHKATLSAKLNFTNINFLNEKNTQCEEGGAHLRISYWHLLTNCVKAEKSGF